MPGKNLLRFGITGTVVTALCCFTPVLVVLFSALGISALTGMLDLVLLPALAIFVGITGFALWKQKQAKPN
jgi:mercuric ion transport protein